MFIHNNAIDCSMQHDLELDGVFLCRGAQHDGLLEVGLLQPLGVGRAALRELGRSLPPQVLDRLILQ